MCVSDIWWDYASKRCRLNDGVWMRTCVWKFGHDLGRVVVIVNISALQRTTGRESSLASNPPVPYHALQLDFSPDEQPWARQAIIVVATVIMATQRYRSLAASS
eukprot:355359-Chlamydomonas_euryale.AAC.15